MCQRRSFFNDRAPDLDDLLTAVHPFETLVHLVGVALRRAHSFFPASSHGWLRRTQIFCVPICVPTLGNSTAVYNL